MKGNIERRMMPFSAFELREAEGTTPELVGYASVFNQETVIEDWFSQWREEVAPGAFIKTLKESDIRALWNHDRNVVLGRNRAGTLTLREDDHGLYTVIRPPDNEWGRPVLDAVRRGDVTGMSITFRVIKQEMWWPERGSQELPKRTIKEMQLFDVSPVTFPAFEQTEISARALGAVIDDDVLLRAGALARRAQMGWPLAAEERDILREAAELLRSVAREPQGDAIAGHSPQVAEDEPGRSSSHHSDEARARRLRLMRIRVQA